MARSRAFSLTAVIFALAACGPRLIASDPPAASIAAAVVYPDTGWARVDRAESVGWSSAGLRRVEEKLAGMSTTGFMVVVGGRVLMDYGDVEAISYLASVRKSVLSMLYGIYVDRGVIDLEKTLAELGIDDVGGLTAVEKLARVKHLLAARSGVYHEASNAGDDLGSAPARGSQPAGTYYLYSNWDFNALGTIFEQATGHSVYDALEEQLVKPLGFRDFDRSLHRRNGDASKSSHLAYHMHFSTRDMARIGYLMLRNGRWRDRQVVPEWWVRESTRPITRMQDMNPAPRRDGPFGYGYLWWVFDNPASGDAYRGAYAGLGAVGQHILVMPALDLVVAHKTRPGEGRNVSHEQALELLELLVRAYCSPDCAVEDAAELEEAA